MKNRLTFPQTLTHSCPGSDPGRGPAAVYLAVLILVCTPSQARETDPLPDGLQACRLIDESAERLACYDGLTAHSQARDGEQASGTGLPDAITVNHSETSGQQDENSGVMSALLNRYMAAERAIFSFSGSFVGHKPMYLLPLSYVKSPNSMPFSPRTGFTQYDYNLENPEAKFQISFKVPLLTGLLDDRTTLWFGYTQKSFWQVYNSDDSAPFRETNFEPEVFFRYAANYDLGPGAINGITLGFNHQSNGQSEPRSRSWNRIKASVAYSYNRWLFMVEPWYRLPEKSRNDDNPDIERYLGYANYLAVYRWSEERTLALKLMNNLRSDNKTSVELGYSFPMGNTLKGYIQYYNGYGESLIDYNERIQRIGIGIMLNDWF